MSKGPDMGKHGSNRMTSVNSFSSENAGTACQSCRGYTQLLFVTAETCHQKHYYHQCLQRIFSFILQHQRLLMLPTILLSERVQTNEIYSECAFDTQKCVTILSLLIVFYLGYLKMYPGLYIFSERVVYMNAFLKLLFSDRTRRLDRCWNGYFQLEVNCVEKNVDLCF